MKKDVVVIGGGSAGSVAALRCAEAGLDVSIVEEDELGGCCLNSGCIPTKVLVNTSELAYSSAHSEELGIEADVDVDYEKTIERKNEVVERLRSFLQKSLSRSEVDVEEGIGRFSSSEEIKISSEDGEKTLEFDKAVIASGSKPVELPGLPFDRDEVIESREFLDLKQLPERLVVVGAGYIGMEIGTTCAKLGSEVTVIEMKDQILPGNDKRLVRPVKKKLDKLGIEFHSNLKASKIDSDNGEQLLIAESKSGDVKEFSFDKCLVAVGRKPRTDSLGLENTEVSTSENGFIETNEELKTENPDIYAAGDAAGQPMLAHKAFRDGSAVGDSILNRDIPPRKNVPEVIFTDPQIAHVGISKGKMEKEKQRVGRAYFKAIEASYTKNKAEGFARLIVDEDGTIRGGDIVGPEATELIHQIALAVQQELTVKEIVHTIHAHPTLSEIIAKAAENAGDLPPYSV